MARLRFPGRPGYRFDKLSVRYCENEAKQTTDASLAVVESIHKGLKRFRKVFGDSDEVCASPSVSSFQRFLCCFCLFTINNQYFTFTIDLYD